MKWVVSRTKSTSRLNRLTNQSTRTPQAAPVLEASCAMNKRLVILLISVFTFSGCIALPYKNEKQLTPFLTGRVVDEVSGDPIANATVSISDELERTEMIKRENTDRTGHFKLKPLTKSEDWQVILLVPHTPGCWGKITVVAKGYKELKETLSNLGKSTGKCNEERFIVIKLKRI